MVCWKVESILSDGIVVVIFALALALLGLDGLMLDCWVLFLQSFWRGMSRQIYTSNISGNEESEETLWITLSERSDGRPHTIRWMDGLLDAICISLILLLSKGFLQRGHTTYCLAHLSHSSSQHMVYVSLLLSTPCVTWQWDNARRTREKRQDEETEREKKKKSCLNASSQQRSQGLHAPRSKKREKKKDKETKKRRNARIPR